MAVESATRTAAGARLHLSQAGGHWLVDRTRVYGDFVWLRENYIERDLREALGSRIYSGTSDMQRLIIARWLSV